MGWPTDMYEPLTLGFVFTFLSFAPWQRRGTAKGSTWRGQCQVFLKEKGWLYGIFCGKFTRNNKGYPPCRSMWCGNPYKSELDDGFFIQEKESFDPRNSAPEDHERLPTAWGQCHQPGRDFGFGRDGDHLMLLFECDLCVFRKLRPTIRVYPRSEAVAAHQANQSGRVLESSVFYRMSKLR
jgi:hypothetical protein